ncbi:MAG: aminotransferase class III-fold pyridoxal phosphate-dependent enzyme, partial [Candidatus Methanomethyliaceae archaeon]
HSNTFGGNPLACAACAGAIEALLEDGLVENARTMGDLLKNGFSQIESKLVREVRGLGLMLGIDMRFEVMNIILKSLERGVIVLEAGKTVLRLLPPLVITKEDVQKVLSVVSESIKEEERRVFGG